jgi:hypothetical protein
MIKGSVLVKWLHCFGIYIIGLLKKNNHGGTEGTEGHGVFCFCLYFIHDDVFLSDLRASVAKQQSFKTSYTSKTHLPADSTM